MHQRPHSLPLACALLLAAAPAFAQWAWIDAKGTRNYSDTPPPPNASVKMLSSPSGMKLAAAEAAPATAAPATAQPATQSGPTLAEREAEFRQRRKDAAATEARSAEAERVRKENEKSCAIAIAAKARYESGNRIRSEKSENMREPMGDAERAAALAQANTVLADCRKAGID